MNSRPGSSWFVHIAAFAIGAGVAWLAFKRELAVLGSAFSLFAAAELT